MPGCRLEVLCHLCQADKSVGGSALKGDDVSAQRQPKCLFPKPDLLTGTGRQDQPSAAGARAALLALREEHVRAAPRSANRCEGHCHGRRQLLYLLTACSTKAFGCLPHPTQQHPARFAGSQHTAPGAGAQEEACVHATSGKASAGSVRQELDSLSRARDSIVKEHLPRDFFFQALHAAEGEKGLSVLCTKIGRITGRSQRNPAGRAHCLKP